MNRTGINVRNGHVLVGEYIARWWKYSEKWHWEVVPIGEEQYCFEIDEKKKEYFEEEFEPLFHILEDGHSEFAKTGGNGTYHCDARAKALGYAHVHNAQDGKQITEEVNDLFPALRKLKQAVAVFCQEANIEVDDELA